MKIQPDAANPANIPSANGYRLPKNKRAAILAACVLIAACLFGSCAPNNGQNDALLWYGIGPKQPDTDLVFAQVNQYLRELGKTYSVRYDSFDWGDYNDKMSLILTSGERADIIFTASWAANFFNNATSGYLRELDGLLEQAPKLKASIPEKFWEAVRVGSKLYSVPNYKDMVYQRYVAFPREVFERLGLSTSNITDLASLTPLLARCKELEPQRTGYVDLGQGFDKIRADYLFGQDTPIALSFAEAQKGFQVLPEMSEYIAQLKIMREWNQKGYIPADAAVVKEGEGYKSSSYRNWFLHDYIGFPGAEAALADLWGQELVTAPLDAPPILTHSTANGGMLSIPSISKRAEDAMSFIEVLNTDPTVRNLVGFGIEGVHYQKIGENVIRKTDKAKGYQMPNFALGSLLPLYLLENERPDARAALLQFNAEAEVSPALSFIVNPEEYRTEIAMARATMAEFKYILRAGSVPVDETLERFRGKLREIGWYETVAKINTAYNQWRLAGQ